MDEKEFLPYNLPSIGDEEIDEVTDSLKSGWLTLGPKTAKFERDIAEYIGVKHAICLNSCTAGLHLSLLALGIGVGDEVIIPTLTFAATGNVVANVGAKPVLVDVEEETLNISPNEIRKAINENSKAIMVVHYSGQSANMDEITKIADENNLFIIEDAAHAIGGECNGKKIGTSGNLTSFSFYATKNMTTGDGGALVTNDDKLAEKIRKLRLHGISKDAWKRYSKEGSWYYEIEEQGWKYNMIDIQAAIGLHQLKKLDNFINIRRKFAEIYHKELSKISGIKIFKEIENMRHPYHLYPILVETYDRNRFISELTTRKIGTSVHFIPLHLHPLYRKKFGYKEGDFPIAEKVFKNLVTLPLYPKMTEEDIYRVIEAIKDILDNGK